MVRAEQDSVVHLDINEGAQTGTGFFINADGYVVTALHVVRLADGKISNAILVEIPIHPFQQKLVTYTSSMADLHGSVIAFDAEHDLALLKTNALAAKASVSITNIQEMGEWHSSRLCSARLDAGNPIFTIGFPLGSLTKITTSGIVASSTPIDIDTDRSLRDTYLVDMHINHGNSGGPVFSMASGCVLGVVDAFDVAPVEGQTPTIAGTSQQLAYNSGIGILIPAEYVDRLLKGAHSSEAPPLK